jgi:hypothetical protein
VLNRDQLLFSAAKQACCLRSTDATATRSMPSASNYCPHRIEASSEGRCDPAIVSENMTPTVILTHTK